MRFLWTVMSAALGLLAVPGVVNTAVAAEWNTCSAVLSAAGEGRRAYVRLNCNGCHGEHGKGGMGPAIAGEGDDVSEVVPNGSDEGMPSYRGKLCPGDLANLKAYLRTQGGRSEPTFLNWWEANPTE
jgi:cytochrome c551